MALKGIEALDSDENNSVEGLDVDVEPPPALEGKSIKEVAVREEDLPLTVQAQLRDVFFWIEFRWNSRTEFFTVSVVDADGLAVTIGEKALPNRDLFWSVRYDSRVRGKHFVLWDLYPERGAYGPEDLGDRLRFVVVF